MLLVGLALLVVLASIGLFAYIGINQIAFNNANAIATTQARDTTAFAANATNQANNGTATALARFNATATIIAKNPDPYPPNTGKLTLNDPLSDNSKGYNWDSGNSGSTKFGTCNFIAGAYHVKAIQNGAYHYCAARQTNFVNFAYEVELTINSGDCGGIIYRADFSNFNYYYFSICQSGSYELLIFRGQQNSTTLRQSSFNPAIKTGLGQFNLIAVVANGSALNLYVNSRQVESITDTTYSQGQIGVLAENDVNNPTEVAFINARVWTF